MEEIGVQEVGEDIGSTHAIVGKDFGVREADLVSYAEWGKCGAVKNDGGVREGCLGHNGHNTIGRDGCRCVSG